MSDLRGRAAENAAIGPELQRKKDPYNSGTVNAAMT
jgi:hypothetical protein